MDIAGTFSSALKTGGVVPWLLVALAVVSFAFAIERMVALGRARIDLNEFLASVRKSLMVNRSPREAIKVCEQFRGPLASIVKAGLLKYGQSREEIERTMEHAALFERGRLERFLPVLATIARVAPLLAFLGTVIGLIHASEAVAAAGAADPRLVAPQIRDALVMTAAGLVLAIPVHVVHGWLSSRVVKFSREVETATTTVLETLIEMARGGIAADRSGADSAREVATR